MLASRYGRRRPKREENAIRGGINDYFTEMSPEDTGDLDVDTFRTNPGIRDADKAAVKWIDSLGGEGANVTLQATNDDGTTSEMNVKLSAGRVYDTPPFEQRT